MDPLNKELKLIVAWDPFGAKKVLEKGGRHNRGYSHTIIVGHILC